MHHKILKHLLSLFFVLVLLTILGLQWAVEENGPRMIKAMQQENEMSKRSVSIQKKTRRIKITNIKSINNNRKK